MEIGYCELGTYFKEVIIEFQKISYKITFVRQTMLQSSILVLSVHYSTVINMNKYTIVFRCRWNGVVAFFLHCGFRVWVISVRNTRNRDINLNNFYKIWIPYIIRILFKSKLKYIFYSIKRDGRALCWNFWTDSFINTINVSCIFAIF